eukprot:2914546-Prymnesium_polylepis.1
MDPPTVSASPFYATTSTAPLCVRGCSAHQSVCVHLNCMCAVCVSHPLVRGYVSVCPDGAPTFPAYR